MYLCAKELYELDLTCVVVSGKLYIFLFGRFVSKYPKIRVGIYLSILDIDDIII